MPKQIKLGFDRIPGPGITNYEPLLDIATGMPLRDENGNQIYTLEPVDIPAFGVSKKSTPVHVNNDSANPLKKIEQFAETSQVSLSLLGIPRAERQLGLFADISTYGYDSENWDTLSITNLGYQPPEWVSRKNKVYGNRHWNRLEEMSNEQALALTAFPTPWSYPYGPTFADVGYYNKDLFSRYLRFIQLGNELFDYYSVQRQQPAFAKNNFLNRIYASRNSAGTDVTYKTTDYSIEDIYAQIESWTVAWMRIRDSDLYDEQGIKVTFPDGFDSLNTLPGYSSQSAYYSELTSKKSYRYQPGRASGFTMGLRASSDKGSVSNVIEWGCANNTDEYVFQLNGSQFNIVRRSVIPLPESNLIHMGLTKGDQVKAKVLNPTRSALYKSYNNDSSGDDTLWETVISRDKFNGDPLNGNGASGYVVSFEQVTMWKVEFSWYGAIGAKFYIYTPTGNGDARWIMIHHLIIENELGKPCLKDPFFKFKYTLALTDTSNLRFPQYVYKYGASYYIDGGDEGTTTGHSYSSNIVNTYPGESRSAIGITAKDEILNSDGVGTLNRKDIIPQQLTISASTATKVDIIECEGCPGFGHHYAPSLQHTGVQGNYTGIAGTLQINSTGDKAKFTPDDANQTLTIPTSEYVKIIGDGIYSSYLYQGLGTDYTIARRVGVSVKDNNIQNTSNYRTTNQVKLSNGQKVNIKNSSIHVRVSGFNDIIVAKEPLTKSNINVNFLNPFAKDIGGHFAEFFIGITNLNPDTRNVVSGGQNVTELFFTNNTGSEVPFELSNTLYADWSQYSALKDEAGLDYTEFDSRWGTVFEIDPRLQAPPGSDTGACSQGQVIVTEEIIETAYASNIPGVGTGNYLIFDIASGIQSLQGLQDGEVGILNGVLYQGSGITFTSDRAVLYTANTGEKQYYVTISDSLAGVTKIAIRTVTLQGRCIKRSRVFTWNVYPLYVVIGMRDSAQINNITIEEYDQLGKFSFTPTWLKSSSCNINVINSGNLNEQNNPTSGLFEAGGLSFEGSPPTNFIENFRLDSAQVDTQLQQPLRPGTVRSSFFVGGNETAEFPLTHVFGQDRYTITPGNLNAKATFVTVKSLDGSGEVQVNIQSKEQ